MKRVMFMVLLLVSLFLIGCGEANIAGEATRRGGVTQADLESYVTHEDLRQYIVTVVDLQGLPDEPEIDPPVATTTEIECEVISLTASETGNEACSRRSFNFCSYVEFARIDKYFSNSDSSCGVELFRAPVYELGSCSAETSPQEYTYCKSGYESSFYDQYNYEIESLGGVSAVCCTIE